MLRRMEMPMTAAGKGLQLSENLLKDAWVLYKETDSGLVFSELYNPEFSDEEYADGIVAVPLTSTFMAIDFILNGTPIWNVIGSTGDSYYGPLDPNHLQPINWRHSGNWSQVWAELTGEIMMCSVTGQVDCTPTQMVGGHMQLTDPQGQATPVGIDVHIIPICVAHNNASVTGMMTVAGGCTDALNRNGVRTIKVHYRM